VQPKKRWSDLTSGQRVAVVAASAVELALTAAALLDLARRPRTQVRGPKVLWFLGCFIQPIGPSAYMKFGRRLPIATG
jgi:hypothetical protein